MLSPLSSEFLHESAQLPLFQFNNFVNVFNKLIEVVSNQDKEIAKLNRRCDENANYDQQITQKLTQNGGVVMMNEVTPILETISTKANTDDVYSLQKEIALLREEIFNVRDKGKGKSEDTNNTRISSKEFQELKADFAALGSRVLNIEMAVKVINDTISEVVQNQTAGNTKQNMMEERVDEILGATRQMARFGGGRNGRIKFGYAHPTVCTVVVEEKDKDGAIVERITTPKETSFSVTEATIDGIEDRVRNRIIEYIKGMESNGSNLNGQTKQMEKLVKLKNTMENTKERVDVIQTKLGSLISEFAEFEAMVTKWTVEMEEKVKTIEERPINENDSFGEQSLQVKSGTSFTNFNTSEFGRSSNPHSSSDIHAITIRQLASGDERDSDRERNEYKMQISSLQNYNKTVANEAILEINTKMEQIESDIRAFEGKIEQQNRQFGQTTKTLDSLKEEVEERAELKHIVDIGFKLNTIIQDIENLQKKKEDKVTLESFYTKVTKIEKEISRFEFSVESLTNKIASEKLSSASIESLATVAKKISSKELKVETNETTVSESDLVKVFEYIDSIQEQLSKNLQSGLEKVQALSENASKDTLERIETIALSITDEAKSVATKGLSETVNSMTIAKQENSRELEKIAHRFDQLERKIRKKADKSDIDMLEIPPFPHISKETILDVPSAANAIDTISRELKLLNERKADRTTVRLALDSKGDARVMEEKANRSYCEALVERCFSHINEETKIIRASLELKLGKEEFSSFVSTQLANVRTKSRESSHSPETQPRNSKQKEQKKKNPREKERESAVTTLEITARRQHTYEHNFPPINKKLM